VADEEAVDEEEVITSTSEVTLQSNGGSYQKRISKKYMKEETSQQRNMHRKEGLVGDVFQILKEV